MDQKEIKVSVIVPLYKTERYIERCLQSVFNQTHPNIEVIVVNDCTPDNSMAIVKRLAKEDRRIHIIENRCNMGTMKTRERGYHAATGFYICFLDSDDYLHPRAIEWLLQKANENDADIVAGGLAFNKKNGGTISYPCALPYGQTAEGTLHAMLAHEFPLSLCAKIFKQSLFTDYTYQNIPNMIISEDCCLLYQLVGNASRIECINQCIYECEDNPASSSHQNFTLSHVDNILISRKIIVNVCSRYPKLVQILDRNITFTVLRALCYRLPRKDIRELIAKHHLEQYATWRHGWHVLTLRQFLSTFISAILRRQA